MGVRVCSTRKRQLFPPTALLSQVLDSTCDQAFGNYNQNGFSVREAFAEDLKTTAEKCQKPGSYVSLPEALSLTSVMGVNLNMIYPDTGSTSGYRNILQGVFSPRLGVAAKTVHIMWS